MVCSKLNPSLHNILVYIAAVKEVQASINVLEGEFDKLKKKAIELLETCRIEVKSVVYELSTLPANEIGQHKMFLKKNLDKLRKNEDHMALFGDLNLYWTYLSPDLLKHLIHKLPPLGEMKKDIKVYMLRLSLQDIEDFRQQYGNHYQLRDFAFLLRNEIQKDSFVVSFWVPESVIELLMLDSNVPNDIFIEFGITQLHIGEVIIYDDNQLMEQITLDVDVMKHATLLSHSEKPVPKSSEGRNFGGYGCVFVTNPPDAIQTDCPVCLQILKEPCMISCRCGKKMCRQCK